MQDVTTSVSDLKLLIQKEIQIAAPVAGVFQSVLDQMGPDAEWPNGQNMNMKFEAWPGGRWFRDLGDNTGHFWGHVQVIKPPTLIEITGPLMMSYPAINHLQYRLTAEGQGTKLTLLHRGFGEILPEHRKGMDQGWGILVELIKKRAEK